MGARPGKRLAVPAPAPAGKPRGGTVTDQRAQGHPSDLRVLLLDDEEAILPTAHYFRGLGCAVDVAREPEEAEALISHQHYDLAILDVRVTRYGGTEGLEVLREIRRRDRATVVIVLSAYISADVEAEARALGAGAIVRKPHPLPALAHLAFALIGARRG